MIYRKKGVLKCVLMGNVLVPEDKFLQLDVQVRLGRPLIQLFTVDCAITLEIPHEPWMCKY